ncbi:MAG: glycoside hydrolase family 2 TIM barrel-domain containing protein, partial [Candidatus Helarchaeota archaeon]
LHPLCLKLFNKGELQDQIEGRFGIRDFVVKRPNYFKKNRARWQFHVNDLFEFIRGANWVPPDSFLARVDEHYEELIKMAKDANINTLRVWGGGIREKKKFYEICDETGILVWQEFPFARNHPSVVFYSGGNEMDAFMSRELLRNIGKICRELDPTRPYLMTSPYVEERHNWLVWHLLFSFNGYDVSIYNDDQLVSEYGLQAAPSLATLKYFSPDISKWKKMISIHNGSKLKLDRYGRKYK